MSSGDPPRGCPNCSCPSCKPPEYVWRQNYTRQVTGVGEVECTFDRIAREYAARGEPMPTSWLLVCNCKRCRPITL